MKKLILSILVFLASLISNAQTFPEELASSLQTIIDDAVDDYNLKGVSGSVILPDDRQWVGVSGIASEGVSIDTTKLFAFGSLTKTFTAAAILQLYEAGELTLSDSLGTYIGPFQYVDGSIPIRKLLNMSTGLYDFTNNQSYKDTLNSNPTAVFTAEQILETYMLAPEFPDNVSNFIYRNSNYLLLGLIVESITGNSIKEEIENRFLVPLNLNNTFFAPTGLGENEVNGAWLDFGSGLFYIGNLSPNAILTSYGAAAGLVSKPSDMSMWIKALHNGDVLNQNTLDSMRTILPNSSGTNFLGYGLGTMSIPIDDHLLFGHKGRVIHHSMTYYSIDKEISISYVINHESQASLDETFFSIFREVVSFLESNTGISNSEQKQEVDIYPNPFSNRATIEFENNGSSNFDLRIYDLSNRVVKVIEGITSNKVEIERGNLNKGVYILELRSKNQLYRSQIIIN